MWKRIPGADKAILIFFGILSFLNILYWVILPHKSFNIPSLVNSLLCFVAIFLFIKNKMISYYLFFLWSIVQIPYITQFEGGFEDPVLNLTQLIRLALIGFSDGQGLHIRFNFLAFFFTGLSYRLYLTLIRGYVFQLIPLKPDTFLNEILPAEFRVVKRVKYKKENDFVLAIINDPVKNENEKKGYFMLRTKDKNDKFKPTKKGLIVYLGELNHNMDPLLDYVPEEVVIRGEWAKIV